MEGEPLSHSEPFPGAPSISLPPPPCLGQEPPAQTLAWPCLSRGPAPCLWAREGHDPRAIASPKPSKARPWSLRAFQPHNPFSSLIIKWPSKAEGPSQLASWVWAAMALCPPPPR